MTGTGPSIDAALRRATEQLSASSDTPRLDAQRLFEHVLGLSASQLIVFGDDRLPDEAADRLDDSIARRCVGEPLAYITGRVGFWTLELDIAPSVLVPRPDTETLVAAVLERLPVERHCTLLDLGTGCGAIALALASERPNWSIIASDQCAVALNIAKTNRDRLGLVNVDLRAGDWFESVTGQRFDAIVSNPPYIAPNDPHLADAALAYESSSALVAADHGLADIRRIAAGARGHLHPGGLLLLEHGATQGAVIHDILNQNHFGQIETFRDLAGRGRVTLGRNA